MVSERESCGWHHGSGSPKTPLTIPWPAVHNTRAAETGMTGYPDGALIPCHFLRSGKPGGYCSFILLVLVPAACRAFPPPASRGLR